MSQILTETATMDDVEATLAAIPVDRAYCILNGYLGRRKLIDLELANAGLIMEMTAADMRAVVDACISPLLSSLTGEMFRVGKPTSGRPFRSANNEHDLLMSQLEFECIKHSLYRFVIVVGGEQMPGGEQTFAWIASKNAGDFMLFKLGDWDFDVLPD